MTWYGHIFLKKKGIERAKIERRLEIRLRDAGVIYMTDDEIDEWYRLNCLEDHYISMRFMLNNAQAKKNFKKVLKEEAPGDGSIEWSVTSRKNKVYKTPGLHMDYHPGEIEDENELLFWDELEEADHWAEFVDRQRMKHKKKKKIRTLLEKGKKAKRL